MAGKNLKKNSQKLIPSKNSPTYLNSSDTDLNQEWKNVISLYTELQKWVQTCRPNSESLHNNTKLSTLESGGLNYVHGNSRIKTPKSRVKLSRNKIRKNKVVCKHQLKTFQKLNSIDTFCDKKSNAHTSETQASASSQNICENVIEQNPSILITEDKVNIIADDNLHKLKNYLESQCSRRSKEEVNFFSKVYNNNLNIEHIKPFCLASGGLETQIRKFGGFNKNSFGIKLSDSVIQELYNNVYYYNDLLQNNNENMTSIRFNLSYKSFLNDALIKKESLIENQRLSISCRKSKSLGDLLPLIEQKAPLKLTTGRNNSFSSGNIQFYSLINKELEANIGKLVPKINYDYNITEKNNSELLKTLLTPRWKHERYTVESCDTNINKGLNEFCVQTVTMGSYSNINDSYNIPHDNYVYAYTNNSESTSADSQKVLTSPKGAYQTTTGYTKNPAAQKAPYKVRSVPPSQVRTKSIVYANDETYKTQNIQNSQRNEGQNIIYDDQNLIYQPQEPYQPNAMFQADYDQQMYYQPEMSPTQNMQQQQGYPVDNGYRRTNDGNDNVTILYKTDSNKMVYEPADVYQAGNVQNPTYNSGNVNQANNENEIFSFGEPQAYPNNNYIQGNPPKVPTTYNVTDLPGKQQPMTYSTDLQDEPCRSKAKCTCCKFCECYKRQNNSEEYDSHEQTRTSIKSEKSAKSGKSIKDHGGEADYDYSNVENASHDYKPVKNQYNEDFQDEQDTYHDYEDNESKQFKGSPTKHKKGPISKSYDAKNSTDGLLDTYTYDQGTDIDQPYDETFLQEPSIHKSTPSNQSGSHKSINQTHHKTTQNEHDYNEDDINPDDVEEEGDKDEGECEEGKADAACDIFPLSKKKVKKKKDDNLPLSSPPPAGPKRNYIYEPKPRNTPPMVGTFTVPKPCIPCIPAPCYIPSCCPPPCSPCPPKCVPVICPPKCPPKCPPPSYPATSFNPTALTRTMQFQPTSGSSNGKNPFQSKNKVNSICAYNVVGTKPKLTSGNAKVMKKNQPSKNNTNTKRGITCETVVTSKGHVTMCKWDNEEMIDDNNRQTKEKKNLSKNHLKNNKVRPSKSDSMLVQYKNHDLKCLTYEIEDPITKINKKSKICFQSGKDIVNYLSKGVQTQSIFLEKLSKNSPVPNEPKLLINSKKYKQQINRKFYPIDKFIEPKKKEKTWYSHHRIDSVETQTTRSYNSQKNCTFPLMEKTMRKRYIYVPKYIHNKKNLKDIVKMENKPQSLYFNSDKMKHNVECNTNIKKFNADRKTERIPRTVSTGMNTEISKITRTVCTYTNDNVCANKKLSKTSVGLGARESNSVYKINNATSTIKEKGSSVSAKKTKSTIQMQRINSQMGKEREKEKEKEKEKQEQKEKYVVKMCGTDPVTKISKGTQIYFKKIEKVHSKTLLPKVAFEPPPEKIENENPLLNRIDGLNKYILDCLKPKEIIENKEELKNKSKSMHKIHFECSLNDSGKPHCFPVHRSLSPYSEINLPYVRTSENNIKKQTKKNETNKKFENIICQHVMHKDPNENFIHPNSSEMVDLINGLDINKDSRQVLKDDVLIETNTSNDKLKKGNDIMCLSKKQSTVKFCCPGCSSDYHCDTETNLQNKNEPQNKLTNKDSENPKEEKINNEMENICVNSMIQKNVENETSTDYDITKKKLSLYTASCSKNKKDENRPLVDTTLYKNGQKFKLGNKATNTGSKCSILPTKKVNRGCSAFDVSPKTNTSTSMSQNNVFAKENVESINENTPKNKIFDTLDLTDGLAHIFLKYLNQNARRLVFDRINQNDPISSIEDIMEKILNSAFVVKTKVQKTKKTKKENNTCKKKRKLLKIKAKLKQPKSRNNSKESTVFNQSLQSVKKSSAELNNENVIKLADHNSPSNNKEIAAKEILMKTEQTKENTSNFIQKVSKQQALCETEIIKTLSEMTIRSSKKTIQSDLSQPNSSTNKFSNNHRSQIKLITSLQQLYGKHLPSSRKKKEKSETSTSNDKMLKQNIKRKVTEKEATKLEIKPMVHSTNINTNEKNLSENINMYYTSQKESLSIDQNSINDVDKKQTETFSFGSQNMSNNEKLPDRGQSDEISEHIFGITKPNYVLNNILDHLLSSNKPSLNEFSRDEFSDNCQCSITDGKTYDDDIPLSIQKLESCGEIIDPNSKVSFDTEMDDKEKSTENNKTQTNNISHYNIPVQNVGHKDWHTTQMSGTIKKNETVNNFTERNVCSKRYLAGTAHKICQDDIEGTDALVIKPKTEGLENRKNKHDEKMQVNTNSSNENDFLINMTHKIVDSRLKNGGTNGNAGCNNIITKKWDSDLEQKPLLVTTKNESKFPALSPLQQENIKSTKSLISNDNKTKENKTQIYLNKVNEIQSSSKLQKCSPTTSFNHLEEESVNPTVSIEDRLKSDNFEKDKLNKSFTELSEKKCSNSIIDTGINNTQTNSNKQSIILSENTFQKNVIDTKYPLCVQNDCDSEIYLTPWILDMPYNITHPNKNENVNDQDTITIITKCNDKNDIQDNVNTESTTGITGNTDNKKNNSKQTNIVIETDKNNEKDISKHTKFNEPDSTEMAKITEVKDNDNFSKRINYINAKNDYEMSTISKDKTNNIVTNNIVSDTNMLNITEVNIIQNNDNDDTTEKNIVIDRNEHKTAKMSEIKLKANEEFLNIDNVLDKKESNNSSNKMTILSNDIVDLDQGLTDNSINQNNKPTNYINPEYSQANEMKNDIEKTDQSYNHEIDCEICNQYKNDLKFTFMHNKDLSRKDSNKSVDIQPYIPKEKLIIKQPSSVGSYERLGDKSDHFLEQITAALEAECKKQVNQNSNKYKHKFKEFDYNRKCQENNKCELPKTFSKNKNTLEKTNPLKQLNIDVLHRQENNTIINQAITSTNHKKTPQIFIKENKDLVVNEPKSQIKEKQLKHKNISNIEHHCLVCSREGNEILFFPPSTSKALNKTHQDFFISNNQSHRSKQNLQDVQDESKHQYKSMKLENKLCNMAQDTFVHTPTIKIDIKTNIKEPCRAENYCDNYYAQPIAKWQVTPSIESILKNTQGPSKEKSKKNDKLNGTEKKTKFKDEQITKRKCSKKKAEQLIDNIKLEKRKKSHKISNDQDPFESESYKNLAGTIVARSHQPKSNELFLKVPKLISKKTKNPIYSTITKTTPSCSYSTSSASRLQPRAEGDSFQPTSTYMTYPCFTINDVFSFSLDSIEKSHLSKTAIDTYLKSLHELSNTLDDQLKLMKFALDEENLNLISYFHANSSSEYSKERSRQLYMHLVSVDKSTKQRTQDCDNIIIPRLVESSQAHHSKHDFTFQKSNSKFKVSKSTMLYVQKELSTLKSQIDQTPYLQLREEIISNKSLTDIEHKYIIKSIDEQLEKLKSIETEVDDLIHELKHTIEGDKDYLLSNTGSAEKNKCLKVKYNENEITFQERLKYIKEALQNEHIQIQTVLRDNEELPETSSKEIKNYLKITSGAHKRHKEKAVKNRSNAKKESFIEKCRRRFSDKKIKSHLTRKY